MSHTNALTEDVRSYFQNTFTWFQGKVVDHNDPLKRGRLKIECFGFYDGIEKAKLPWAIPLGSMNSFSSDGNGRSPTGIYEGAIVFGFFLDGTDAQQPVYMSSFFGAPNGISDVFGNAREEQKIPKKKRLKGKKPFGGEFQEPDTNFGAKYPWCHTTKTVNGHIYELDDTAGSQRFHYRHPSGTDIEIDKEGVVVIHGQKEHWTMTKGDIYLHTDKSVFVSTKKDANLKVEGNVNMEVEGNYKGEVKGNYELKVTGNYDLKVEANSTFTSGGTATHKASMIMLN